MRIQYRSEPFPDEAARTLMRHSALTIKACPDGWEYTQPGQEALCTLRVTRDYSEVRVWRSVGGEAVFLRLLQTALECVSVCHGALSLHSACVEMAGQAVAFTAASGTGKSTRASAWMRGLGASLISGDRPQLCAAADGFELCGVPWDGKEQVFRNIRRPVRAVLEIRRAAHTSVRRLNQSQKMHVLKQQCFVPMWDPGAGASAMMLMCRFSRSLPMYRVFCGPDEDAARAVYDILFDHPDKIKEAERDMQAKKGFTLREVVGEYLIMPTGDSIGQYNGTVVLNEVSAFIWEKLQAPISYEDLLDCIRSEYDVDETTAKGDLDRLLARFREYELLDE